MGSLGPYLLFMILPMFFAMWASSKTKSAFKKYSQIGNSANLTGAQAAARMLESKGITVVATAQEAAGMKDAVAIEATRGFLSDHYDPRHKVLRLSEQVYSGRSLAAVGVACHEAGHALQDAHGYALLKLRSAVVPAVSFGSKLAFPMILIGLVMSGFTATGFGGMLAIAGLVGFALIVVFQLITLPVEFDASNRAKAAIGNLGITRGREEDAGVATVLNAAALTYVAALAAAIGQMLYWAMIVMGGRR